MMDALRDNLIAKLGRETFARVQETRIGIAGAGGLGSNCAANLVRIGFRRLTIIDFDTVDPSNLDRQFFFADQVGMHKVEALAQNLLRINPDLDLSVHLRRLGKSMFAQAFTGCGIVAECLDTAECKSALVSELLPLGKLLVAVSGLGGFGSSDEIRVHVLRENLVVIGDLRSDIATKPALSPRVAIAAAKQADVILSHVSGRLSRIPGISMTE